MSERTDSSVIYIIPNFTDFSRWERTDIRQSLDVCYFAYQVRRIWTNGISTVITRDPFALAST